MYSVFWLMMIQFASHHERSPGKCEVFAFSSIPSQIWQIFVFSYVPADWPRQSTIQVSTTQHLLLPLVAYNFLSNTGHVQSQILPNTPGVYCNIGPKTILPHPAPKYYVSASRDTLLLTPHMPLLPYFFPFCNHFAL
jgi:hypothetical protein